MTRLSAGAGRYCFTVLTWCTVLLAGCFIHSDNNRPGDVDVTEPPPQKETPVRVQPDDPGAFFVAGSIRPLLDFGRIPGNGSDSRIAQIGGEASVGINPDVATANPPFPVVGIAAGWLPFSISDSLGSRVYLQADKRAFPGPRLSAGWSLRPTDGFHGPQITFAAFDVIHIRWNWDIGAGSAFTIGMSVPLYIGYTRPP